MVVRYLEFSTFKICTFDRHYSQILLADTKFHANLKLASRDQVMVNSKTMSV